MLVPYLNKILWSGRGKEHWLKISREEKEEDMQIMRKLLRKLFCVEICGRHEREIEQLTLSHVNYSFKTQFQGTKLIFCHCKAYSLC